MIALTVPTRRDRDNIHRDIRIILHALAETDSDAVELTLERQALLEALAIDVRELERNGS